MKQTARAHLRHNGHPSELTAHRRPAAASYDISFKGKSGLQVSLTT